MGKLRFLPGKTLAGQIAEVALLARVFHVDLNIVLVHKQQQGNTVIGLDGGFALRIPGKTQGFPGAGII